MIEVFGTNIAYCACAPDGYQIKNATVQIQVTYETQKGRTEGIYMCLECAHALQQKLAEHLVAADKARANAKKYGWIK